MNSQGLMFLSLIFFISSCQEKIPSFTEIETPCKTGGESNLFSTADGKIYMSWIEYLGGSDMALKYSQFENISWKAPKTIASGDNWFVNWADFPSFVGYQDGKSMAAHWLQKSASGTYDYDVRISQSNDNGQSWSESFIIHNDGISAEHGFVSMVPLATNRVFATWLDGRYTKDGVESTNDHEHNGAMTLRSAEFDIDGNIYKESQLDDKVCECCQTSAAMSQDGLLVVYRNRSNDEIRDIYIAKQIDDHWQEPRPVYSDNWKINGCPVNGPVVKTYENMVGVAWFTMAEAIPKVNLAFSRDNGLNFELPIRIDDGNPIGRVYLVHLENNEWLVSWLEQNEESADIRAARVNMENGITHKMTVKSTGSSRQSGFPRMTKVAGSQILFSWTSVDSTQSVKSGILTF